jgi:galactose mutarotase-like enzyme
LKNCKTVISQAIEIDMLHTIENDKLICAIESDGAEIRSLKDKVTNQEYIWQIKESVWGGSSPVLFPSIGKIKDDKISYKGKDYAMPKHGIIRNNGSLIFEKVSNSKCTFTLQSSSITLRQYPFKFIFQVQYELIENQLVMTYNIENRDTVPMYFSCGGHTAYACPLSDNVSLSDYVIEFPTQFDFLSDTLSPSLLLSERQRKIDTNRNVLSLSETLFNEDALIFSNINFDWVRLRRKNAEKGVIIRFKDYPHLALWAKPGADYVCIEPWLGLPDRENESNDISQKSSYKMIDPNIKFSINIITEVE